MRLGYERQKLKELRLSSQIKHESCHGVLI